MHFTACGGCQRHVRADDESCPFCGADVVAGPDPMGRRAFGRIGRAALFVFGASLAAGASSCIAAYGAPPDPGDAGPGDSGPQDAGGPAPAYGAAPAD